MIGFYDYTVVLTYLGALAGLLGVALAAQGNYMAVILCMAAALFCDTFDGIVARNKKGRTEDEMRFGIQIDSLCDLISFGVCPAAMFYFLGLNTLPDMLLLGAYTLCCVIRLGYFNVLAGKRELGTKGDYHGLPVVCLDVAVPAVYMLHLWLPEGGFLWCLRAAAAVFGFLYIFDFKVKKPNVWKLAAMCVVFWIPVAVLYALA